MKVYYKPHNRPNLSVYLLSLVVVPQASILSSSSSLRWSRVVKNLLNPSQLSVPHVSYSCTECVVCSTFPKWDDKKYTWQERDHVIARVKCDGLYSHSYHKNYFLIRLTINSVIHVEIIGVMWIRIMYYTWTSAWAETWNFFSFSRACFLFLSLSTRILTCQKQFNF